MAAVTPPLYLQASLHASDMDRRAHHMILGGRGGVLGASDLAVTQNGTPNMSVNVADGRLWIPGTEGTYQGLYFFENRGTQNLAIAAADATNPRRDLVIARVRDQQYSGATNNCTLEVVTGAPAASPVDPAVPANSWVLARVAVAPLASSITNANITDFRSGGTGYTGQNGYATTLGGTVVCTSSTRPAGTDGLEIYETDTKKTLKYNSATAAYVELSDLDGFSTNSSPTITQTVSVSHSPSFNKFQRMGRFIIWQFATSFTSSGTTSGVVQVTVPITASSASSFMGIFNYFDSGNRNYGGAVSGASTSLIQFTPADGNNALGPFGAMQVTSGDSLGFMVIYEAGS